MTKVENKFEWYQTSDFSSVFRQCEMTQKYKLMTGLIADTGMGKSTSVHAYASAGENVFVVTVDKTLTAKQLLSRILETITGRYRDDSAHDILSNISARLHILRDPLLIIDEAGKMNHVMMLYIHDLRECTKEKCGIILAGMPYFRANLIKYSERQKEGCSELFRRINVWHKLEGLSRKEIEYICKAEGIEGDYREYYGLRFGDLMNKILLDKITNEKL